MLKMLKNACHVLENGFQSSMDNLWHIGEEVGGRSLLKFCSMGEG